MVSAQQVAEAQFDTAPVGRPGYDEVAVDEFLDRVVDALEKLHRGDALSSIGMTSIQIVEAEFPERPQSVVGGYDMDQVDDLLDLVARELFGREQAGGDVDARTAHLGGAVPVAAPEIDDDAALADGAYAAPSQDTDFATDGMNESAPGDAVAEPQAAYDIPVEPVSGHPNADGLGGDAVETARVEPAQSGVERHEPTLNEDLASPLASDVASDEPATVERTDGAAVPAADSVEVHAEPAASLAPEQTLSETEVFDAGTPAPVEPTPVDASHEGIVSSVPSSQPSLGHQFGAVAPMRDEEPVTDATRAHDDFSRVDGRDLDVADGMDIPPAATLGDAETVSPEYAESDARDVDEVTPGLAPLAPSSNGETDDWFGEEPASDAGAPARPAPVQPISFPAKDHRVPLPSGRPRLSEADVEAEANYHPEYSEFATPEGEFPERQTDDAARFESEGRVVEPGVAVASTPSNEAHSDADAPVASDPLDVRPSHPFRAEGDEDFAPFADKESTRRDSSVTAKLQEKAAALPEAAEVAKQKVSGLRDSVTGAFQDPDGADVEPAPPVASADPIEKPAPIEEAAPLPPRDESAGRKGFLKRLFKG